MVSGTKGSHLVLDNPALFDALGGHLIYFENVDGRVCIVCPYQGRVLAGATDIRVDSASRMRCEPEELDYILDALRIVFPNLTLKADQVLFSFSGIRPLSNSDLNFTGRISRGHVTRRIEGPVPQFCMVGGKWTTFRAFAEQTSDEVLAELGKTRRVSTLAKPIGGGANYPNDPSELKKRLTDRYRLSTSRAMHLVDHYGSHADEIALFCQSVQDAPLTEGSNFSEGEITWLLRKEFVETLSDIVLRRTSLAISGQISMASLDRLNAVFAEERKLNADEIRSQREELIQELDKFHGVAPEILAARN